MKKIAYIAVVIDAEDFGDAADIVAETMRDISDPDGVTSPILDWQYIDRKQPFDDLGEGFEYENWTPNRKFSNS